MNQQRSEFPHLFSIEPVFSSCSWFCEIFRNLELLWKTTSHLVCKTQRKCWMNCAEPVSRWALMVLPRQLHRSGFRQQSCISFHLFPLSIKSLVWTPGFPPFSSKLSLNKKKSSCLIRYQTTVCNWCWKRLLLWVFIFHKIREISLLR